MGGFAEAGVRHAFDQNFRGGSHFLPRQARGVIVDGDPCEGGLCLAKMVEAARRGWRRRGQGVADPGKPAATIFWVN